MAIIISDKTCSKCKLVKPTTDFYFSSSKPRSYCKVCDLATTKKSRRANYERNLIKWRETYMLRTYGITLEDYELKKELQGHACYICGATPKPMNLVLDHDHETNAVRKFLCRKCNFAVAVIEDMAYLDAVSKYVEEHI